MNDRKSFDLDAYIERIQNGPCFICEMITGGLSGNHVIYQDDEFIAFLNKYPPLYGYVLVAPIAHKDQVTGDFSLDEYLSLQRAIYRVAEAVQRSVKSERLYILSLGSQQGNRHVHWHVAPLPYGVPFKEQQLEALRADHGILSLSDQEMAELAVRIRNNMSMKGDREANSWSSGAGIRMLTQRQ
jgi:diadenosine tetraphosphate (Ap4A) HIT family hydrolase